MVEILGSRPQSDQQLSPPIEIFKQCPNLPGFRLPLEASTCDPKSLRSEVFYEKHGEVALPMKMDSLEEAVAILRLHLKLPQDMALSTFLGACGSSPVTQLQDARMSTLSQSLADLGGGRR